MRMVKSVAATRSMRSSTRQMPSLDPMSGAAISRPVARSTCNSSIARCRQFAGTGSTAWADRVSLADLVLLSGISSGGGDLRYLKHVTMSSCLVFSDSSRRSASSGGSSPVAKPLLTRTPSLE